MVKCVLAASVIVTLIIYLSPQKKTSIDLTPRLSGSLHSTLDEPFSFMNSLPVTKDLIVHSVYFDERSYREGQSNITVIFLTIKRTIFLSHWITSCGIGSKVSNNFLLRPTHQQKRRFRTFMYEQYVLECYNLPVVNGSRVFVGYKTANNMPELVVEAEVMIPAPRVQPTGKYNFTVATCTKAFNRKLKYLSEFVRYQKTLGVDHVHLSVLDEFMRDGSFHDIVMRDDFLHDALSCGYLTIAVLDVWYAKKETFLYSSIYQRLGCFYRLRGTYDYISIADTDDFFTPRIPGETDMKHYIQEYCIAKTSNAGSCQFKWRWLYPDVCGTSELVGPDGNVTKTVNVPTIEEYYKNTKSIHSGHAVIDFSFHDAKGRGCMLPGYKVVEMPPHIVYFVHNRLAAKDSIEKNC